MRKIVLMCGLLWASNMLLSAVPDPVDARNNVEQSSSLTTKKLALVTFGALVTCYGLFHRVTVYSRFIRYAVDGRPIIVEILGMKEEIPWITAKLTGRKILCHHWW